MKGYIHIFWHKLRAYKENLRQVREASKIFGDLTLNTPAWKSLLLPGMESGKESFQKEVHKRVITSCSLPGSVQIGLFHIIRILRTYLHPFSYCYTNILKQSMESIYNIAIIHTQTHIHIHTHTTHIHTHTHTHTHTHKHTHIYIYAYIYLTTEHL